MADESILKEVEHLEGKARRDALQKVYESRRPPRKRPGRRTKKSSVKKEPKQTPREKKHAAPKGEEDVLVEVDVKQENHEEHVDDPLVDGSVVASTDHAFTGIESKPLVGNVETPGQSSGQCCGADIECQRCKILEARCHWYEHVRDWIANDGRATVAELVSHGYAPPWVRWAGVDFDWDVTQQR